MGFVARGIPHAEGVFKGMRDELTAACIGQLANLETMHVVCDVVGLKGAGSKRTCQ